jgi:TfoX/Sxy family transcriptional regulator of competence genes
MSNAGTISYKFMFGGYALYCEEKVVALLCNEKLFIKPTEAGKSFVSDFIEDMPYEGAKPYILIEDKIDDKSWLGKLVAITAKELPAPKAKKKKGRG